MTTRVERGPLDEVSRVLFETDPPYPLTSEEFSKVYRKVRSLERSFFGSLRPYMVEGGSWFSAWDKVRDEEAKRKETEAKTGPFSFLSALSEKGAVCVDLVFYPISRVSLLRAWFSVDGQRKVIAISDKGLTTRVEPPPAENLSPADRAWGKIEELLQPGKAAFSQAMWGIINRETAGLPPEEQKTVRQEIGKRLVSQTTLE